VSGGDRHGWRERLFGDRDRLGWWLLPMFVAVGLAGAVLAGSLAVVFASQRVDRLTRETAGARADLVDANEEVRQVADEALEAIEAEVDAVRDEFGAELPYEDAAEAGVVHLVVDAADGERRASGFVVARDGDDAFVATTFSLAVDRSRPEVPLDVAVRVVTAAGETRGGVHSWQAERDLLLLRVPLRGVEPLPWRPAGEELTAGARVTGVGVTPALGAVRVGGTVAANDPLGLVTDLPPLHLLTGGPVVDGRGQVVAVGSTAYSPFGADPVAIPIRLLCEELLARCPN
jgi:hypothetical protein